MSARSRHRSAGLRRRGALDTHSMHFGPNMTPMVDVVMVILIFFMASAAFMGDEWFLRAAIPFEAGRGSVLDRPNDPMELPPDQVDVVLTTDGAGRTLVTFLTLNSASMEEFEARVAAFPRGPETAKLEVVIKPAAAVPYQDLIRAHSALLRAGVVKLAVQVKQGSKAPASPPKPELPPPQ